MTLSGLPGLGDAARLLAGTRRTAELKTRLATHSQELSTGRAADPVRAMRGDTRPLADIERRLGLAQGWGLAAREAGERLGAMQQALGSVEAARASLLDRLMAPAATDSAAARADGAEAGAAAFGDIARQLNATFAGGALFAGTAADGPALQAGDDLLAAARAAAAGATTAAGVEAALDAWLAPGGGFEATGYLGAAATASRPVDDGEGVALAARADDPAIRALLRGAAMAALASDPAVPLPGEESQALLGRARDALLTAGPGLTSVRAGLGLAQGRAEEAASRHAARAASWTAVRGAMTEVDPYATATTLQAVQLRLETHYEVTARLASLSLANRLR